MTKIRKKRSRNQ